MLAATDAERAGAPAVDEYRVKALCGSWRRVFALCLLGYAYIAAVLVLLLASAAGVVYVAVTEAALLLKLLVPIGAVWLVIARSVVFRVAPPDGISLSRREATTFFDLLEQVGREVRGPKLHAVQIDQRLNAGIVQVPRAAGMLGSRSYLVVGMPLLYALPEDELRAVIAHELAHLSRSHGRLALWTYRVRASWTQLLGALEERQTVARLLFRRFFEWYVPTLAVHTAPLMRQYEFEADRIAADAVGAQLLGRALCRVTVADSFLDARYWPSLFARARDERDPPTTALSDLSGVLVDAATDENASSWIAHELAQETHALETHPSLAERLGALGLDARLVEPDAAPFASAARLLGNAQRQVEERLDLGWQEEVLLSWQQERERMIVARLELGRLEKAENLNVQSLLRRAGLTEELRDADAALERYREVLEAEPSNAEAHFAVGRLLLDRGDAAGISALEQAMDADPDAIVPACLTAAAFLDKAGRRDEAERFRQRAAGRVRLLHASAAERESYSTADAIEAARLARQTLDELRHVLRSFPEVERAYVARKRLEHLADEYPHFLVCVVVEKVKQQQGEMPLAERLVERIDLPGSFHVLVRARASDDVRRFAAVGDAAYTA